MGHIRPASILDLNNYFKIKDLLGGLTLSQQETLRKNIGVDIETLLELLNQKIKIDDSLSATSTNAVQNKVITAEVEEIRVLINTIKDLQSSQIQKALDDSNLALKMSNTTSTQVETLTTHIEDLDEQIDSLEDKLENIEVGGGCSWVDVN